MKKNLVLTIAIGDFHNEIAKYTKPIINKYAKKINADFLCITDDNLKYPSEVWNKFEIFNLFNKYNRIIYFDIDLIIRDDTPNLFDMVPETSIGLVSESRHRDKFPLLYHAFLHFSGELTGIENIYYSTGVMVISRMHKQLFQLPEKFIGQDDVYLNYKLIKDKVKVFELNHRFNRMHFMDRTLGVNRFDSYIIHYSEAPKNEVFEIIKKDLNQWEKDSPNYKYDRNILIRVSAGMGDQLCSEPVIRYIQKIYKDSKISIVTHFPRLFKHLNVPIYDYKTLPNNNDAVIVLDTCPDEKTAKHNLSHALFHATDFCSLSTIRKTIPVDEKKIKLMLESEDVSNIMGIIESHKIKKPIIVIHPGKWWPSKTFPTEWWQEVVNGLSKKLCVCLIGKTLSEEQGYLPIECPEDGIDFRDLTTLGELMVLISIAKVTLTNDSSPLHIAGAFDNWIVVIPTAKHPDHILPFRNGGQTYKTKALYKKLLIDDLETRHTEFVVNTIDDIPKDKTMYDYIPDPNIVIKEVLEIYDSGK